MDKNAQIAIGLFLGVIVFFIMKWGMTSLLSLITLDEEQQAYKAKCVEAGYLYVADDKQCYDIEVVEL